MYGLFFGLLGVGKEKDGENWSGIIYLWVQFLYTLHLYALMYCKVMGDIVL